MPKYRSNIRFSDCWSSVGDVTFYHRNGVCFWKKKACPEFPGTLSQMEAQSVHLRALQAWRNLDPVTQEQWNMLALTVQSHRPPFRKGHHITGHNLFVSGYHGFAQLGNEHVPTPRAFEELPVFTVEFGSASVLEGDVLSIKLRTMLEQNVVPSRYRLAVRIQLTTPGSGRRPGYLRSFVATNSCTASDCIVEIQIPGYKDIWDLDLLEYQVHMRYFLIDAETGYRNIFKKKSFLMNL